jgi:hypothetical protein
MSTTNRDPNSPRVQINGPLNDFATRVQRYELKLARLHAQEAHGWSRFWKEFEIRRTLRALSRCEARMEKLKRADLRK